jgi:hypothetical protein
MNPPWFPLRGGFLRTEAGPLMVSVSLLDGEVALTSAFLDVRGVVKLVGHPVFTSSYALP